jgi:hypothetical protein
MNHPVAFQITNTLHTVSIDLGTLVRSVPCDTRSRHRVNAGATPRTRQQGQLGRWPQEKQDSAGVAGRDARLGAAVPRSSRRSQESAGRPWILR